MRRLSLRGLSGPYCVPLSHMQENIPTAMKPTPTTEMKQNESFCEECGQSNAERIADRQLCLECYTLAGACCGDDACSDEAEPH